MPKIQCHLRDRAKEREVSEDDLFELAQWKARDPEVPDGEWYKDFGTFKLCGTEVSEYVPGCRTGRAR